MSLLRRTMSGAATVGIGQGAGQAMAFVRNLVIARVLGPDQFGVAAAFAMTMSLLEMFSDLAVDRLITQAADGNRRPMQSTLHTLQLLRGLVTGAVLFAAAQPLALFFDAPEAGWAFQWLALAPVLRGLRHLDTQRYMRRLVFRPAVLMDVASQVAALAAGVPLALILGDYTAMLWAVLVQAAAFAVASHLLSRRPFRMGWSQPIVHRALAFGVPVVISGLLMGVVFHGDKFLVAGAYGRTELGLYAVAYGLALVPSLVIAKVNASLALPLLAPVQTQRREFDRRYSRISQALAGVSSVYAVGFITAGPPLLVVLYGKEYAPAAALVAVLGVRQAVRVLRAGPSQAAMALGETTNVMIANMARVGALGLAIYWATQAYPLVWIALAGLIGEVAGLFAAVIALRIRHGLAMRLTLLPTVEATVLVGLAAVALFTLGPSAGPITRAVLLIIVGGTALAATLHRMKWRAWRGPVVEHTTAAGEGA